MKRTLERINYLKDKESIDKLTDLFQEMGIPMGSDQWANITYCTIKRLIQADITLNRILNATKEAKNKDGQELWLMHQKKYEEESRKRCEDRDNGINNPIDINNENIVDYEELLEWAKNHKKEEEKLIAQDIDSHYNKVNKEPKRINTLIPPSNTITQDMILKAKTDDYYHFAQNLNALMKFGYCSKCGLVPEGCLREGCKSK